MGCCKGIGARFFVLGAALALVWLASYSRALELRLPARPGFMVANITLYRGLTSVTLIEDSPTRRTACATLTDGKDPCRAACWDEMLWRTSFAGLSFANGMMWLVDEEGYGVARQYRGLTLPLWLMVLSCGVVPAQRLRRNWLMTRRAALGHCRDCGYDLHGLQIDCPACIARQSLVGGSSNAQVLQPV